MAPEIIEQRPVVDYRGDMYSWGMCFSCLVTQTPVPSTELEEQLRVRAGFKFHRAPRGVRPGAPGRGWREGRGGRKAVGGWAAPPGRATLTNWRSNGIESVMVAHEIRHQIRTIRMRNLPFTHTHIYIHTYAHTYIYVCISWRGGVGGGGPPGAPEMRGAARVLLYCCPQLELPDDAEYWVKRLWQKTIVPNAKERWTSKESLQACGSAPGAGPRPLAGPGPGPGARARGSGPGPGSGARGPRARGPGPLPGGTPGRRPRPPPRIFGPGPGAGIGGCVLCSQ